MELSNRICICMALLTFLASSKVMARDLKTDLAAVTQWPKVKKMKIVRAYTSWYSYYWGNLKHYNIWNDRFEKVEVFSWDVPLKGIRKIWVSGDTANYRQLDKNSGFFEKKFSAWRRSMHKGHWKYVNVNLGTARVRCQYFYTPVKHRGRPIGWFNTSKKCRLRSVNLLKKFRSSNDLLWTRIGRRNP